ncbi:cysteine hydrolase family protein [Paenibacillus soyae]|uniref:Cysteine hydrolase n=1 Tax=Paenibacillus soyae TaxID=2969249 RepID=A0A9X2MQR0_9BACL|nr:isochorismatase family cysteine hydrolase [Paenibacillus soyae]MCR2804123.1 cysteine hydrolase [Paenibacillus soyae]
MKIGFLIIDMQSVHLQDVEKKNIKRACEYINYVADMLRSKDQVVLHVQDIEGMTDSNKDEFNILPEIQIDEKDVFLTKESSNSFWKTDLEQLLNDQGVDFLVIAGNAAEHCVLFTYNGALERGFNTVILQNGILSRHPEAVVSTYRDRNIISHPAIKYMTGLL